MPNKGKDSTPFITRGDRKDAAKKGGRQEKMHMEAVAKVILLGNTGTGKSCLLQRYLKDTFTSNKQMVGIVTRTILRLVSISWDASLLSQKRLRVLYTYRLLIFILIINFRQLELPMATELKWLMTET